MRHRNGEKWREIQAHCAPKPQTKTRNTPIGVANSVMERKFLWLRGTTTNNMKPEINLSQYVRIVRKSNTKGYRIIPYYR